MKRCLASIILVFFSNAVMFAQHDFVRKQQNKLVINKQPYRFVGANMWYANLMAMEDNKGGSRNRLLMELDFLQQKGVNNIRVLIGSQGQDKMVNGVFPVHPALQTAPGKYNEAVLDGMDFLLQQLQKRKMHAVFFFGNNWEWSGGFLQYLNWHDQLSDSVLATKYNWDDYRDFVSRFYSCTECKEDFWNFIKYVLQRTNKVTGRKYINEPSVMAWEIANEPRPMRSHAIEAYKQFLKQSTAFIKRIDPNHLVTLGTEGYMGTESKELFREIHEDINTDYATIHIWPKNWGWYRDSTFNKDFKSVVSKTVDYIQEHDMLMQKIDKPLVVEEFGLPRDQFSFSLQSTVNYRNQYFEAILKVMVNGKQSSSSIAGINFWTFSGFGKPAKNATPFWEEGDDLLGDPPMEEQGLNSVFAGDTSTWILIHKYVKLLKR